jgi:hypothetical protein
MKVRELLQIEIWSKRTHGRLVIGFVTAIVGVLIWLWIDGVWLTGRERKAARSALVLVDGLKAQVSEDDQKDFDKRLEQAKRAVDAADQAGWTGRDKQISLALRWYFDLVTFDRIQRSRRLAGQRNASFKDRDTPTNLNADLVLREEEVFNVTALHHTLEK